MSVPKITPCLWFDRDAEQAIEFYSSVFPGLTVAERDDWPEGSPGGETGLLTAVIELAGQRLMLLNAGPEFPQTEAFSLYLDCADAAEVDYYWGALLADGGTPSQCGWLKDRFGVSWQVVPRQLTEYLADPDRAKAGRVWQAMLKMSKIEVAELDAAAAG
jgi:predicted 3-demethylubiquinone-9 3-methyltransferase (glyoxalase superfamily)